jgi:hypothetical protein
MPIVFSKDISTTTLLLAYVNNVVEFKSDSELPVLKADIYFGDQIKTLYPAPDGSFWFNFKELIKTLVNVDNFTDDMNLDVQDDGYVYDWTNKAYLAGVFTFRVTFSDLSFEQTPKTLKWLSALMQLENYKRRQALLDAASVFVLSPFAKASNLRSYVKYWEGFPFDITLFVPETDEPILVTNQTNLLDYSFEDPFTITRLAFSDGNDDVTLEDVLPLAEGFNDLKIENGESPAYYLTVEKIVDGCGTYLKWINELGGWNYWLFHSAGRTRAAKDIGELANDYQNLPDTISPTVQMGRTSNDTLPVLADSLTPDEVLLLEGIFDSPKVYLFTGEPNAKNRFNDWLEVSIRNTSLRVKQPKQELNRFELQIELPQRITRTL